MEKVRLASEKSDLAGIAGIFFDAAGTLFHLPRGVGFHYRDVMSRHGVDVAEDRVARAFGRAWQEQPPPPVTRMPRPDDDRGWWRALVERVFSACGVGELPVDREALFAELYREFTEPGVWELYPEVLEVLTALAPRFSLGVITNFDGRFHRISAQLGLTGFFQTVTISSAVGADKPDPWIFQQALHAANLPAGAALHAGDDPGCDWQGAEAAGMQAFRLQRPQNSLRELLRMIR